MSVLGAWFLQCLVVGHVVQNVAGLVQDAGAETTLRPEGSGKRFDCQCLP